MRASAEEAKILNPTLILRTPCGGGGGAPGPTSTTPRTDAGQVCPLTLRKKLQHHEAGPQARYYTTTAAITPGHHPGPRGMEGKHLNFINSFVSNTPSRPPPLFSSHRPPPSQASPAGHVAAAAACGERPRDSTHQTLGWQDRIMMPVYKDKTAKWDYEAGQGRETGGDGY